MSNLVKIETKREAVNQIMMVDKYLGDTIMQMQEVEDEAKEIRRRQNESPDGLRLKEIAKLKKILVIERYEAIGQRKLVVRLLKKLGVNVPQTKLTKLIEKDGEVRQMVEAH